MKQITDEMILSTLQRNYASGSIFIEGFKYFAIALIITTIILFLIKKYRAKSIITLICSIIFIFIWSTGVKEHKFIEYAIKNHSWVVATDIVVEKDSSTKTSKKGKTRTNYYLYLKENGKVSVSGSDFFDNNVNDSVYIILLINGKGEKYVLNDVYSPKYYEYNKK